MQFTVNDFYFRNSLSQGCRDGGVVRALAPMWPTFDSQTLHHMWVEFVGFLNSALRGFSLNTQVFPSPQKKTRFIGKFLSVSKFTTMCSLLLYCFVLR